MPDPKQVLEQARISLADKRHAAALELVAAELKLEAPSPEALRIAGQAQIGLGRLEQAAELLQRSLRAAPDCAEAHHALGNVHQDSGRIDRAIASYRRALRIQPDLSAAENDLGTAYFAKGWHRQATEAFERCVRLDPANHRALENLGSALRAQGQYGPARRAFQRAFWIKLTSPLRRLLGIRAAPAPMAAKSAATFAADAAQSSSRDAYQAYLAGRYEEAERLCAQSLERTEDDFAALHVRALILNRREQFDDALAILERLVGRYPDAPEIHDALGSTLRGLRRFDDALESFNRALALKPLAAAVHSNVSSLMLDKGEFPQAETAARAALEIDPDSPAALINLGIALLAQDRPQQAETQLRRALEVNPQSVKARLRLCEALRDQDNLAGAKSELEQAGRMDPANPDRYLNLGILAQDFEHDIPSALEHYRSAQRLSPQHAGPYLNEALLRFMNGDFSRETWDLYEWRKKIPYRVDAYGKVALAEWDGSKVGPGELLVFGEQGLGDEIMFASMLPQALALAPKLRFAAQPRLRTLFARSIPEADVIAWDRTLGPPQAGSETCAVAIGSLGRFFRCSSGDFPRHAGYLKPDPARVDAMRARLDALGPARRIGLSWRGGLPMTKRSRRTLTLAALAMILARPGISWINLQPGDIAEEVAALARDTGVHIAQLHDATQDFEQAAALVHALDLVISACSTTVHLCGALGAPVWVMAPFAAEWRYGFAGERMPWYPSAVVLRQPRLGDWQSVVSDIGARLDANARMTT